MQRDGDFSRANDPLVNLSGNRRRSVFARAAASLHDGSFITISEADSSKAAAWSLPLVPVVHPDGHEDAYRGNHDCGEGD
jgi:hypothetical protein